MKKKLTIVISVVVFFTGCNNIDAPETDLITSFTFPASDNQALEATVYAVISGTSITAEFPYNTTVTALRPAVETREGFEVIPASGSVLNFSRPVYFLVATMQGVSITYTATVTLADE